MSYSQLAYLSITHHGFYKFLPSVLEFIFILPVFFLSYYSLMVKLSHSIKRVSHRVDLKGLCNWTAEL